MIVSEVNALVNLWNDVKGTQPAEISLWRDKDNSKDFEFTIDGSPRSIILSNAKAYDLVCGHLRRWLEERPAVVGVTDESVPAHSTPMRRYGVGYIRVGSAGAMIMHYHPTRLLALIAAVRAVAGKKAK